jgi:hypothetical protein
MFISSEILELESMDTVEGFMDLSLEQFVERCFSNLDRDGDGKKSFDLYP